MTKFLTHLLTDIGYPAILILGFLEAACFPISAELTFGFGGVLAAQGHLNLVLVMIIGGVGELGGSLTAYAVGRRGGRRVVYSVARFLLFTKKDVDRAERFFVGRGAWVVAVGRVIPVIRAIISIIAGVAEVPFTPFALFNLLGTTVWAIVWTLLGYAVGKEWSKVAHGVSLAGYLIAGAIAALLIGHWVLAWRKQRRDGAVTADGGADAGVTGSGDMAAAGGVIAGGGATAAGGVTAAGAVGADPASRTAGTDAAGRQAGGPRSAGAHRAGRKN